MTPIAHINQYVVHIRQRAKYIPVSGRPFLCVVHSLGNLLAAGSFSMQYTAQETCQWPALSLCRTQRRKPVSGRPFLNVEDSVGNLLAAGPFSMLSLLAVIQSCSYILEQHWLQAVQVCLGFFDFGKGVRIFTLCFLVSVSTI